MLGSNNYTARTTISAGTLQVGNGGSGASIGSTGSVSDYGALVFNRSDAVSFSPSISGSGSLAQAGNGVLTLLGSNTFSGGTTVSAGTLQLGNGGNTGYLAGSIAIGTAGTLVLNRSDNVSISNTLTGPGALVKTGGDTVTLTGNLTGYTGLVSVSQGQLVLAVPAAAAAYTATSGGTLQFNGASVNLGSAYASVQALSGGLVQYQNANIYGGWLDGPGTHVLLAATSNTFNDVTIDPGAVVQQNGPAAFLHVTNYGRITGNGGLVWSGGLNAAGGSLTLGGVNTVAEWSNQGTIVIPSGGVLNNHLSNLTSSGGGQITINSGGTLNADSLGEGVSLNLQGSLLVNNGTVTGTTNVDYLATIAGAGMFGPINVSYGTILVTPSGSLQSPGVTLDNGTIAGNGLFAAPATIVTNVTITPSSTGTLTLTNNLSGSGQVIVTGQGTVMLLGSNTYTGATTISGGTLQVGNGGSGASIGGTSGVFDNGALVFNHGDATTLSVVSGNGSLTQAGSGILILLGSSTYSGRTTISGGTLQVGSGGSGASIGGTSSVLDNGALVFNHGDAVTFSLPVGGNGSLTQAGTGILTLTGGNTYSGPTMIAGGTLQVGNGGSGASIGSTSSVLDNGVLVFNHGDAVTFAPLISGNGSLTQTGTGILTLLGSNTYSGPTMIAGGTLQVGNGGSGASIGGTSGVLDNGALVFDHGDATTLSVVSGNGSLTQTGTGILILLGGSNYSGPTTIAGGTLQVGSGGNGASIGGTSGVLDNGGPCLQPR